MKNQRRTILLTLLAMLALTAVVVLIRQPPKEPEYEGKRLTDWLAQYATNHLSGSNPDLKRQAETAVQQIGTNAIPFLLTMMTTRGPPRVTSDSILERFVQALKSRLLRLVPGSWSGVVSVPSLSRNGEAAFDCRLLGAYGFIILGSQAKPGFSALVDLLHDQDLDVRDTAVFALRSLGPVAADAVPWLVTDLRDPDRQVRVNALLILGDIHQEPERVIPRLAESLDRSSTNAILRFDAMWALRQFGAKAKPAVPSLLALFKDSDAGIRSAATNTLKAIDSEAAAKAGIRW